ncbi:zinc-binding dehydrogenase [Pseudonocardia sp. NPDC049154]|uniref:zinc-binding dehydrogenase n=1 Tax=Pseudonocardia sp. NPDC049154 TaxID=3155501 RepID=UPI003410B14A
MRVVEVSEFGGPEVLQVADRPAPAPQPGQVRIRVGAAGVNFADVMTRLGRYPHANITPCVPGFEVAGEVVECGPGVTTPAVGDRVAAVLRGGGYAEQVCVEHRDTVPLPDRLGLEEGAGLLITAATAWAGLRTYGNVQAGERVLVMAAAGGVGTAALQIARAAGAEVHGAASSPKLGLVRSLGAHAHDYTTPGWEHDLPPFDLVMDAIGGDSFARSYALLRPGGRLVPFGAAATFATGDGDMRLIEGLSTAELMVDSKVVVGLDLRVLWDDRGTLQPWLTPLRQPTADGTLTPVVAEAVPFAEAARAHRLLGTRATVGKVVLVP